MGTQPPLLFAVAALEEEFHKSVDVYLGFCKKIGQEPEKPFSGKIHH